MPDAPLTVLQLTHQGLGSGSTRSILDLSAQLSRRGHRVLVGCPEGTLLARLAREARLEVLTFRFGGVPLLSRALARAVAGARVDVVNSHASRDRRALAWLRWTGRLPQALVVTRRTMPLTTPVEVLAVAAASDRTIAVSRPVAAALRRRLHPAERLRVVHNGLDPARVDVAPSAAELAEARTALAAADGLPLVIVVARRKDQDVLLRALPLLERAVAVVCVGIAADARLRDLAAAIPSRHRVVFVPFTERPLAFYRLASVAALPSRIEGLSQSLLEAMALGLPVLASDAGGNPDLVEHERTGLLVPPLDPAAWARGLERLLGEPALAARVADAGRDRVRGEFRLERTAELTERVYREALARRVRGRR
jgi:glycosyltransferase involved in cell wall biosynthesis